MTFPLSTEGTPPAVLPVASLPREPTKTCPGERGRGALHGASLRWRRPFPPQRPKILISPSQAPYQRANNADSSQARESKPGGSMGPRAASAEDTGGTCMVAAAPEPAAVVPSLSVWGPAPAPRGLKKEDLSPGLYPAPPAYAPSWLPRRAGEANVQARPRAGRVFYLIKRRTGSPLNPFFSNTIK